MGFVRLVPSFNYNLRNVFEENIKKADGIDPDLRKNVSLGRRGEEQKER